MSVYVDKSTLIEQLRATLATEPTAAAWIDRLPQILASCETAWDLQLGEPYAGSHISYVAPAMRSDGASFVVKAGFRGRESQHEALALRCWDGRGAVYLIDELADGDAMLLEHAEPGGLLADADPQRVDRIGVMAELLRELARPIRDLAASTDGCGTLADEARWWACGLVEKWRAAGEPFDRSTVDRALELIEALVVTQGEQVLLHQDLHGHNVVASQRSPWLAIDPKPLVGELEFVVAPIVRSNEFGHAKREVWFRCGYFRRKIPSFTANHAPVIRRERRNAKCRP